MYIARAEQKLGYPGGLQPLLEHSSAQLLPEEGQPPNSYGSLADYHKIAKGTNKDDSVPDMKKEDVFKKELEDWIVYLKDKFGQGMANDCARSRSQCGHGFH